MQEIFFFLMYLLVLFKTASKMAWLPICSENVKGGGPQGATIGLMEYLSQSNNSTDCVKESERVCFIDDLLMLEVVNLLTVGITSLNIKQKVANYIRNHNQYIPWQNLESQEWLNTISDWTVKQKIMLNEKKSKTIIAKLSSSPSQPIPSWGLI